MLKMNQFVVLSDYKYSYLITYFHKQQRTKR